MASSACMESVADALKQLEEKSTNQLMIDKGNELLISSQGVCRRLLQQIGGKVLTLQDCLQGYAQACLDYTYVDENLLVEEEFSELSTDSRIRSVFELLDKVIQLASDANSGKKLIDLLSHDLYECILWRKGALLYMYCASIERDDNREKDVNFIQNLEKGIRFLQDMLKVRVPLTESQEEVVFNDIETLQLLQSGLFSDVHVLALMYSGEMCYWYVKYAKPDPATDSFDAKTVGIKLLHDYVKAIKGPLNNKGWNCERAEELYRSLTDT